MKNVYRVIILIGILIAAAFVVIPVSDDLLGENVSSALNLYSADFMTLVVFYAVPLVLLIAALVVALIAKAKPMCFIMALVGGVIFIAKDFMFMFAGTGYAGCLINAIGAIIAMAGAALFAFDTEDDAFDEEEFDGAGISADEMNSFFANDFYESGEDDE